MDKKAWILSKSYTNKSLDGVTTIKGANCEIDSITPSPDGKYNTVVFVWIGTSTGQRYTTEMKVYNGDNGRGIKNVEMPRVGDDLHLVVTYGDDTTKDVGAVPVPTVEAGETTTVDYDQDADVTSTATATGVELDFKIPRGEPGSSSEPIWNEI